MKTFTKYLITLSTIIIVAASSHAASISNEPQLIKDEALQTAMDNANKKTINRYVEGLIRQIINEKYNNNFALSENQKIANQTNSNDEIALAHQFKSIQANDKFYALSRAMQVVDPEGYRIITNEQLLRLAMDRKNALNKQTHLLEKIERNQEILINALKNRKANFLKTGSFATSSIASPSTANPCGGIELFAGGAQQQSATDHLKHIVSEIEQYDETSDSGKMNISHPSQGLNNGITYFFSRQHRRP
ncbi:hypothetical protein [Piscirickettsia litoralis]|uniref:Uncharacterized protein n=1 Tax=Piscirickettsia litoralis TaxID=1891921 RepID=A0ABX2ZYC2_9GAMM|nr:hypothetical protein [Piscirickettsia litoralis]ODN41379.1 hypothetical protein BGC07_16555 [Piscirickettsia litoralis]